MRSPLHPTFEDLHAFLASSLVVAACFMAFKSMGPTNLPMLLLISGLTILSREVGQRLVAYWMQAYITVEATFKGSASSLVGALTAFLTGLPVILLFPLASSFEGRKYEHWGHRVDNVWSKRQYILSISGLTTLFTAWMASYFLEYSLVTKLTALFFFFQLMPFRYEKNPSEHLDGAHIISYSGFTWLIAMTVALTMLGLTFY